MRLAERRRRGIRGSTFAQNSSETSQDFICGILGHYLALFPPIVQDLFKDKLLVLVPKQKAFTDFRDCMIELLRPLDLHERMGWYYVSIGRHLLGKIPEAVLAEMPFEKVEQLARVAKTKAELPAELIERAKDPEEPAAKLREEVDIMLYHGAPNHSDGPKRSLTLVAGKKLIDAIQEKIDRLRPAAIEEGSSVTPSDAEVVDFALADCLAGIQETEVHEMGQSRHVRG